MWVGPGPLGSTVEAWLPLAMLASLAGAPPFPFTMLPVVVVPGVPVISRWPTMCVQSQLGLLVQYSGVLVSPDLKH